MPQDRRVRRRGSLPRLSPAGQGGEGSGIEPRLPPPPESEPAAEEEGADAEAVGVSSSETYQETYPRAAQAEAAEAGMAASPSRIAQSSAARADLQGHVGSLVRSGEEEKARMAALRARAVRSVSLREDVGGAAGASGSGDINPDAVARYLHETAQGSDEATGQSNLRSRLQQHAGGGTQWRPPPSERHACLCAAWPRQPPPE